MNENIYKKLSDMLSNSPDIANPSDFFYSNNLGNLLSDFTSKSKNYNEKNEKINNINSNFDFSNLDMETIMRIKKVMEKINSNQHSPRTNLLASLRPYLNSSKKEKLDQYIQFMNISSILETFNKPGGDT